MSFRSILSIITVVLIGLVLFLAKDELLTAWGALEKVNLWIIALTILAVLIGHIAAGEMMFSYLRKTTKKAKLNATQAVQLSMEMNFVNHVFPSGGVSGLSYMTWRLGTIDVSGSKAAIAQAVRYFSQFASFIFLLIVSIILMLNDKLINGYVLLVSVVLVACMMSVIVLSIFLLSKKSRLDKFANFIHINLNKLIKFITFGKKSNLLKKSVLDKFFDDLYFDYTELMQNKKNLILPFIWGIVANIADIALFMIVFWSMGIVANPAPVFIAYGLASLSGVLIATPGGVGAYEIIMVTFLKMAGVPSEIAIVGVVMSRVITMLITILIGYIFYQQTLIKYGKRNK